MQIAVQADHCTDHSGGNKTQTRFDQFQIHDAYRDKRPTVYRHIYEIGDVLLFMKFATTVLAIFSMTQTAIGLHNFPRTQMWRYASIPSTRPMALITKTAFSSHRRLVSKAIAAMAMAI